MSREVAAMFEVHMCLPAGGRQLLQRRSQQIPTAVQQRRRRPIRRRLLALSHSELPRPASQLSCLIKMSVPPLNRL